jgi:hypothetical protein
MITDSRLKSDKRLINDLRVPLRLDKCDIFGFCHSSKSFLQQQDPEHSDTFTDKPVNAFLLYHPDYNCRPPNFTGVCCPFDFVIKTKSARGLSPPVGNYTPP